MSDTKFTPGPWLYGWFAGEGVDPEKQQWAIGLSLDDGCAMGCRGDDYMLVSGICKEGDARVMAASTNLYEALCLVRYSSAWNNLSDELKLVIVGALDKATGEL